MNTFYLSINYISVQLTLGKILVSIRIQPTRNQIGRSEKIHNVRQKPFNRQVTENKEVVGVLG